jgi:TrmH family RNA methyltransferase
LQHVEDPADPGSVDISSPSNPRVKWLQSLRRRRVRDEEHLTVVEGFAELVLALDVDVRPRTLVTCPDLVDDVELPLVDRVRATGAEVVTMSRAAFAKVSYRESPDGWLAVVPDPAVSLTELEPVLARADGRASIVLVCEAVEKPGNLGAMLRTAEAAGVDAVVAASPVADWGNPNVVRASKGTVFAVPIAAADAGDVVAWLRSHGLHILVATPDADREVPDVDLTGPTAIVVGAEHEGVSARWFDPDIVGPDATAARLPMVGQVNSLNVATSAALVLYELTRQRR